MKCLRTGRIAKNDVTRHWKYSSPRACCPGNGRRTETQFAEVKVWTGAEEADDRGRHATMPELPSSPEVRNLN